MRIEKEFIPYEESLALKELGYRDPCFGFWLFNPSIDKPNEEQLYITESCYFGLPEYCILAPTFSQAFRWFREKYKVDSMVQPTYSTKYQYRMFHIEVKTKVQIYGEYMGKEFKTYEEAELACLRKLIKIAKEKNNEQQ